MLDKIPQSRLIIYTLILALIPSVFIFLAIRSSTEEIRSIKNMCAQVQRELLVQKSKKRLNEAVKEHYSHCDTDYLENQLSNYELLQEEKAQLKSLGEGSFLANYSGVNERLSVLKQNKIQFTDESLEKHDSYQEAQLSLASPIKINQNDLKKILNLIEGQETSELNSPINRPQLIITNFRLDRLEIDRNNETFSLQLKLIKREFS